MWKSEVQRHLDKNPPQEGDNYLVTADGAFVGYRKTQGAATRLMNKLAKTHSTAEWRAIS